MLMQQNKFSGKQDGGVDTIEAVCIVGTRPLLRIITISLWLESEAQS